MTAWLLVLIVFLAFFIEATLGFGATVVAVALGAFVIPIPELLPPFVLLNLVLSTFLVVRYRHDVDLRLLLRRVVPLMVLGMPAGFLLFGSGDDQLLCRVFGAFVVVLSSVELYRLARPQAAAATDLGPVSQALLLVSGGVIHGAFATGGPMAVYVTGRVLQDKSAFRSTLSLLWLVLNGVLAVGYAATGAVDGQAGTWVAILAVPLLLGILAGEWLHHRVNTSLFRVLLFVLLLVAGVLLALTS